MLKVTGIVLLALVVSAAALDVAVSGDKPLRTRKPRKGAKLVPVTTYQGHWLPKKSVVIVPKGDPRAYAPGLAPAQQQTAAAGPARPTLTATASPCATQGGTCKEQSTCTGRVQSGLCPNTPNSVRCCFATTTPPVTPPVTPPTTTGCGVYSTLPTTVKKGNTASYTTVPIPQAHLTEPSKFGLADNLADNNIVLSTACKFEAMRAAAAAAGVTIKISSGFRTLARQQYFYSCYKNCNCNNCNKAALPGNSNHGTGIALDLNTDCGGQVKGRKAPAACKSSKVYMWLLNNGRTYGFIRAVDTEPWHYELHPGQAKPWYQEF